MRIPAHTSQTGFSVVEALVAIAVASVILTLVGSSLRSVHQSFVASDFKARAVALAQEALEITAEIQNQEFACLLCATCTGLCTRSDGQQCTPRPGYTSCWTERTLDAASNTSLYLKNTGGVWHLTTVATPVADPVFTRTIHITNLSRDNTSGAIVAVGTPNSTVDFNSKKIQVTMDWNEGGTTKSLQLEQILTGWKNLHL